MSFQEQTTASSGAGEIDPKLVTQNLAQTMELRPECRRFLEIVRSAGEEYLLGQPGFTTVFVPANEALTSSLGTEESREFVRNHLVRGGKTVADLKLMKEVEALSGQRQPVTINAGLPVVGGVSIVRADIACTNGFVHIIERPLP